MAIEAETTLCCSARSRKRESSMVDNGVKRMKPLNCNNEHQTPCLLIPPQEEEGAQESCLLFNLGERKFYDVKCTDKMIGGRCFIGSSHGYMIFIDRNLKLVLINPLSDGRIELPGLDAFLGRLKVTKNEAEYRVEFFDQKSGDFFTVLLQDFFHKVILTSDPCSCNKKYGVVLIYGRDKQNVAYYNNGVGSWTCFSNENAPYHDTICYKNQIYALGRDGCIEVWDLDNSSYCPAKRVTTRLPFPERSLEKMYFWSGLCNWKFYLVESSGNILLLVRFIGELVNANGEPVLEENLLTEESTHPLVCPYRTLLFHVYKLDLDQEKWVSVESLDDSVLFLGGNHSASISACDYPHCEVNSIYFTDDYWCRMDEDYLYGGHDMGVFKLNDGSIEQFYDHGDVKIQPPPCFILTKSLSDYAISL